MQDHLRNVMSIMECKKQLAKPPLFHVNLGSDLNVLEQ